MAVFADPHLLSKGPSSVYSGHPLEFPERQLWVVSASSSRFFERPQ